MSIRFTLPIKTTNPNNGSAGFSRHAAFAKARRRKDQRATAGLATRAHCPLPPFPLTVTITRLAPSGGLDPHDGLGAALKGVIDGIADGLGLTNDRDPRVTWVLGQRRSAKGVYAVEVTVTAIPIAATTLTQDAPAEGEGHQGSARLPERVPEAS